PGAVVGVRGRARRLRRRGQLAAAVIGEDRGAGRPGGGQQQAAVVPAERFGAGGLVPRRSRRPGGARGGGQQPAGAVVGKGPGRGRRGRTGAGLAGQVAHRVVAVGDLCAAGQVLGDQVVVAVVDVGGGGVGRGVVGGGRGFGDDRGQT